jgi:hypothetical protein
MVKFDGEYAIEISGWRERRPLIGISSITIHHPLSLYQYDIATAVSPHFRTEEKDDLPRHHRVCHMLVVIVGQPQV